MPHKYGHENGNYGPRPYNRDAGRVRRPLIRWMTDSLLLNRYPAKTSEGERHFDLAGGTFEA